MVLAADAEALRKVDGGPGLERYMTFRDAPERYDTHGGDGQ